LQPYVFGLGVTGLSLFMMGAGTLGVSRRHWDITFADALLKFEYPPVASLLMGLNGLSAALAALGGLMYIAVVVGSVFFGKRKQDMPGKPQPAAAVAKYGSAGTLAIPGTVVLVTIFFISFVLYYFVNWKYLSEVWPLR
jgi:cytochrome c oxidase subunit 1